METNTCDLMETLSLRPVQPSSSLTTTIQKRTQVPHQVKEVAEERHESAGKSMAWTTKISGVLSANGKRHAPGLWTEFPERL